MNNHIIDEWVKKNDRSEFFLKYPLNDRVLRLFAVACCKGIWNEITDEQAKKAVGVAELYADGLATKDELEKAVYGIWKDARYTTYAVSSASSVWYDTYAYIYAVSSAASAFLIDNQQHQQQGLVLASMYPVTFNDNWITSTTKTLAQQIYDNKDFSLMPILADALQDVDCNEEILNHLRGLGPFYKGNYIIDKLIGKRQ